MWNSQNSSWIEEPDPNSGYCIGDYESLVWAIMGSDLSLDMVELLLARGTVVKEGDWDPDCGCRAWKSSGQSNVCWMEHGERSGDSDLEEVEEYGGYDHRKLDDRGAAL